MLPCVASVTQVARGLDRTKAQDGGVLPPSLPTATLGRRPSPARGLGLRLSSPLVLGPSDPDLSLHHRLSALRMTPPAPGVQLADDRSREPASRAAVSALDGLD